MNVHIDERGDHVCEHGVAVDVHCCGCHSGFIFDPDHVCGENKLTNKKEKGSWLRWRCYKCGHRLRFASNGCPQCGEMFDGRKDPKRMPEKCDCDRCTDARK